VTNGKATQFVEFVCLSNQSCLNFLKVKFILIVSTGVLSKVVAL